MTLTVAAQSSTRMPGAGPHRKQPDPPVVSRFRSDHSQRRRLTRQTSSESRMWCFGPGNPQTPASDIIAVASASVSPKVSGMGFL